MLEEEEAIRINRETLGIWLRPLGFGRKARTQRRHRKRRKRSEGEGQMLFLDGSPHKWFGEERTTLVLCTDDATGEPLYGVFREHEDLDGCFVVCQEVFTRFGLPVCFYLDRASQFTTTRRGGVHVRQRDDQPTQFERAMRDLGVRLIFADSPEARGRAERINETFQDRLVAEFALRRVTTSAAATRSEDRTPLQWWDHFLLESPSVTPSKPPTDEPPRKDEEGGGANVAAPARLPPDQRKGLHRIERISRPLHLVLPERVNRPRLEIIRYYISKSCMAVPQVTCYRECIGAVGSHKPLHYKSRNSNRFPEQSFRKPCAGSQQVLQWPTTFVRTVCTSLASP